MVWFWLIGRDGPRGRAQTKLLESTVESIIGSIVGYIVGSIANTGQRAVSTWAIETSSRKSDLGFMQIGNQDGPR